MRTWIERVSLRDNFAGREGNSLDRVKAMKASGWDLVVLIPSGCDYVICLGYRAGPGGKNGSGPARKAAGLSTA